MIGAPSETEHQERARGDIRARHAVGSGSSTDPRGGLFGRQAAGGEDRFLARAFDVAVTPGQAALAHQRELRPTRVVVVRPAQGGACP